MLFASMFNSMYMKSPTDFENYKKTLKDWYGFSMKFPKSAGVNYVQTNDMSNTFTFGTYHKDIPGNLPTFAGGPVVELSESCRLVLIDKVYETKPCSSHLAPITEYTIPNYRTRLEAYLLNNCALPWARIYYEPNTGVILSKEDQEELAKKIGKTLEQIEREREQMKVLADSCMNKNLQTLANSELTMKTNSDRIFIVRMPNINKIACNGSPNYTKQSKGSFTECYGIEFYRADRFGFIGMLVFFDGVKGKNIEYYVRQICQYVKFDTDFIAE